MKINKRQCFNVLVVLLAMGTVSATLDARGSDRLGPRDRTNPGDRLGPINRSNPGDRQHQVGKRMSETQEQNLSTLRTDASAIKGAGDGLSDEDRAVLKGDLGAVQDEHQVRKDEARAKAETKASEWRANHPQGDSQ